MSVNVSSRLHVMGRIWLVAAAALGATGLADLHTAYLIAMVAAVHLLLARPLHG